MTSAEYRTLREACGLSQGEAATFHDVALRTIAHWETGRNNIPSGAAQELLDLNATIERGVTNMQTLVAELAGQHGTPDQIALTRYRTPADYAGSRADREGLPWPCHNALIARTMLAMQRAGRAVVISWADPAF
jgi:DNA-binding XRE family transcriptional regulator